MKTGIPLRWIWIWVAVVVLTIVATWHFKGGAERSYEPLLMMILLMTTLIAVYVTMRFTRRLNRLRTAVEQINLRDLGIHVPVEGTDTVATLARSFNLMVERLNAQERVRRQFFADLTHEIRHPIAILLGRLESIQDGVLPLSNEQVLQLHDTALGLKRLVNDMNDLSLAEVGQLSLHLAQIDVVDLVEQIQANIQPVAEDLGIKLCCRIPMDIPPLQADADRVRQILVNLLTNALHHTPKGGQVNLTTELNGKNVIFRVIDNGSGIEMADIPYLFERFYRADRSRSRTKGGSGLGLSIVRSLVELHGGTVQVESTTRLGSTFTVCLPLVGPRS